MLDWVGKRWGEVEAAAALPTDLERFRRSNELLLQDVPEVVPEHKSEEDKAREKERKDERGAKNARGKAFLAKQAVRGGVCVSP